MIQQIERESENIIREWRIVLDAKRRGELTDTTRMDAAKKALNAFMAFQPMHGWISVRTPKYDPASPYVRYWELQMDFVGKPHEYDKEKWRRILSAADQEMRGLGFVLPSHLELFKPIWPVDEDEEYDEEDLPDEWFDDAGQPSMDEKLFRPPTIKELEEEFSYSAVWPVDVWVWFGPEPQKKGGKCR